MVGSFVRVVACLRGLVGEFDGDNAIFNRGRTNVVVNRRSLICDSYVAPGINVGCPMARNRVSPIEDFSGNTYEQQRAFT